MRVANCVAAVLAAAMLVGCESEPAAQPLSVTDTIERGPISFTVEASPKQVWLGDPITIELRFHTPDGYDVEFPTADALLDLTVVDEESSDPRPGEAGGLDWRHVFTVESYRSGPLEIPPLAVKYVRKTDDADTGRQYENELATGTLELEVLSALTTQDSIQSPRDITATLTAPPRKWTAAEWTALGAAIAVAFALLYVAYRLIRRRLSRPKPPILPEIWAFRALAELEKSDWFAKGRVREYYYRLSEVVRSYIELKFAVAAPEMTTEEFLVTLARDASRLPYDSGRLRAFLEACDIVKYAAFTPRGEDADDALRSARAFVDATAAAARQSARHAQPEGRAA
ncbi:MAG: hypothetical protein IID33_05155 [Planctomycetes bacterium]|nr:hypothetical protein [Planctomycetota bacterium]